MVVEDRLPRVHENNFPLLRNIILVIKMLSFGDKNIIFGKESLFSRKSTSHFWW